MTEHSDTTFSWNSCCISKCWRLHNNNNN